MSSYALRKASKLVVLGQWQEACQLLLSTEQRSADPRLPLQRAVILNEAGHSSQALELLDKLIAKHTDFVPAYLFAGIAAWDAAQWEKATALWSRAKELAPRNEVVGSYWALAQFASGAQDLGRMYFERHGFATNRGFLVRITEWVEDQWLEAGRFFAPRPAILPNDERLLPTEGRRSRLALRRAAVRAFRAKEYERFLALMQAEPMQGGLDAGDLFACAVACEMLCAYETALSFLDRIPPVDQSEDPVLAVRGRCNARLGRYDEALDCFERVLMIGPEDFGTNYYLGVLCLAHQQRAKAREFFHRAYREYLVDTLDYQFWQIRRAVLDETLPSRQAEEEASALSTPSDVTYPQN
ncbi:MAG: tetratricopeptide repeat protein [Candidatus Sumerlaeaceae bacterium]